jgi:hypothetical protein
MKRIIAIVVLLSCISFFEANAAPAKIQLKVLYVGYSPEKPVPQNGVYYAVPGDRLPEIYRTRMAAFKTFLEQHFTTVQVVDVRDYKAGMSDQVDVTIMDAGPVRLPAGFNRPMVLMHAMAPLVGMPIGLKFDWYCQCLDGDALNIRTTHEIFNTPNKVKLTLKEGETPSSFFNGYQGKTTPKQMPMWKVVTQDFGSTQKYLIGMVAHGEGFDDSPDAEAISGGVCWKNAEAVSLGRHGNYFMWGFAGSPEFMTDEANLVFVNAICYIKKFDRMPAIVKKVQVSTRTDLDEIMYRLDREVYDKSIVSRKEGNDRLRKLQQELKDKKAAGEDIGRGNEALLKMPLTDEVQSFEDYVKGYVTPELFARFGTDTKAYHEYYKANYEYYYVAGQHGLQLDTDAQKLGLSNRNTALLDKCIHLLEQNKDTALARRILIRYTTVDFKTAAAWRTWFTRNKAKLFYTEAGGFKFMVNTYGKPAVAPVAFAQAPVSKPAPVGKQPTADDPVVLTATLLPGEKEHTATVVINANILRGWHIYAYVSGDNPFIQTETLLELPEGATTATEWETSAGIPDPAHEGIITYEGQTTFKIQVDCTKVKPGALIKCGLYYQVCDLTKCFPPRKKMITLKYVQTAVKRQTAAL